VIIGLRRVRRRRSRRRRADQPPAPLEVRQARKVLDHAVTDYNDHARIAA
jgi:hypothetical protein